MVSVIVPTLNAAKTIGGLLEAIYRQSVEAECIVIDSASTDDTVTIATDKGAKVITIKREDFDHGATRTLAAQEAKGDFLVFMTQDAYPFDDDLIAKLIKPFDEGRVAAAFARQVVKEGAIPPEKFSRSFNYPPVSMIKTKESIPHLGIKTFFFSNVCSAVRRDVFWLLGGFPKGFIMDEDLLFAAKAIMQDYAVAYTAEARVFHFHNYGWKVQMRRYFDTGVFFRDNEWLLESVRLGNEGARLAREQMMSFIQDRQYRWALYVIVELICKYCGYKLGFHYKIIPRIIRKTLSLHRRYWDKH